jgi:polyisoprenoid-binding protein YceI
MTVKSVVVALGLLASAGLAAGAQSKSSKTTKAAAKPAPANLHLSIAPTGNEARYRVREQLVGIDFPTDAVGKAHDITGMIVVKPDGTIIPDSSRITINVQTMKSDKSGRDKSLRTQAIETDKFPTVQFVPTSFVGLTAKPGAADAAFKLTGNLTVHGATHPVTWDVTAHSVGNDVVGSANTQFVFEDFGMTPPKKAIVLTVMDTVKLEYDFNLVQTPPQ